MKVVVERFKSLETLMESLEERPLNTAFEGQREVASQRKESDSRSWYGTTSYNDAENVMKIGYKEPLEKMKKAILKIGESDKYQKPRAYNAVVGYAPHVPNYLMNLPTSMINRDRKAPKKNTIHLTYSFCASAMTTPEQLIQGGINFISLVNSLEKQGYRVKIDAIFTTVESKTVASFVINLKEYGQRTNLLKLAFPLVHPSMLRRFAFKWLETTPELKDRNFAHNAYGMPLNAKMNDNLARERQYLLDNGILKDENSYYCNVYTAINAKGVKELAERMEIN